MTCTTNSMGVKSSLSNTTWNIWGGLVRCARRSSTTESSLPTLGGATGFSGFLGFWVAVKIILAGCARPYVLLGICICRDNTALLPTQSVKGRHWQRQRRRSEEHTSEL